MAIDFPNSPTTGQTFTAAGVTWKWDGTKWTAQTPGGGTTRVGVQTFTASGTYVPSANLIAANSGSGGGGGSAAVSGNWGGAGGGAGATIWAIINNPAASYSYAIGAGGVGGTAGATVGGNGAAGIIVIKEIY